MYSFYFALKNYFLPQKPNEIDKNGNYRSTAFNLSEEQKDDEVFFLIFKFLNFKRWLTFFV